MPLLPLDIGKGSNPGRHPHAGVARLVNCYAEAAIAGKAQWPVWPVDGLSTFATLPSAAGGVRAQLAVDATLYAVAGRVLYGVDGSGGAVTTIGGIPSDGLVTMARNRQSPYAQIAIVCDGLYSILQNNVLTVINSSSLPPPNSVCWLDGYFIFTISDGRYFITAIDEGTNINALDFASAESNPDGLLIGKTRGRDLVLFGPRSIEFHQNTGNIDFPFARSTAVDIGCYSAKSVTNASIIVGQTLTDTLAWLATDSQGRYAGICLLGGYQARTISTPDIDRLVQTDRNPLEITGTSWVSEGHSFIAFSGTDWTRVYDTVTGQWHDRQSSGGRWRCSNVVAFGSKMIAGDASQGTLYEMSRSYLDEAGTPLVMTLQTPPIGAFPQRIEFNEVWLNAVPGVGLTDSAVSNPPVMMQWSPDGENWSSELWRGLGRGGQNQMRAKWTRLGTSGSHGRSYRFSCSAAVARGFLEAGFDGVKVPA